MFPWPSISRSKARSITTHELEKMYHLVVVECGCVNKLVVA